MISQKSCIAYKGIKFTIEWYYNSNQKSPAKLYFSALTIERQEKLTQMLITMGDIGHIKNKEKFRNEDQKIYAFKPKPDRFFCFFFVGSKIIITNAYEKKTDKLSPEEHKKAMLAQQDYITRCKQGIYYET